MTTLAVNQTELRCWRCDKLLAKCITPPYEIACPRCKATNKKDE